MREHLGDEEHAGLIVQRGASVIFAHCDDPSVTVTSLEQAVEETPELVEPWLGQRLPVDEGKFAAANAAFWTGGAFIHVPKNTQLEKPIQVVYLIDEPGTAQYAHTLAVIGEHAECQDPRVLPGGRLRGPGAARRRLRAVRPARRPGGPGPLPGLGPRRGARRVDQAGRGRARRPREVGARPPRRPPDQADAGHHHRRGGLGHAPLGAVLHRARRAPRPVHLRQARGGPHHRRHRVEGRAHRRVARVLRGPDPHRAEGRRDPHLPADALHAALAEGQGRRHPLADRGGGQRLGLARRHRRRARRGPDLLHGDPRHPARRGGAGAGGGLLRGGRDAPGRPGLEDLVRRRIAEKLASAEDQVREFIGERA